MNPPSLPVLVAVSGGSDSIALLHRLHGTLPKAQLFAATVDHGFRAESAAEALRVKAVCEALGVPHTTLNWAGGDKAAAAARSGRYGLLLDHARAVGAETIALGHTMDDQAETVLMRAVRLRSESNTRGLAGMSVSTHHEGVTLWRPLLGVRRETLRAELRSANRCWIDDPSNKDVTSERVRVRRQLRDQDTKIEQLSQFASHCLQSRTWLAQQTAMIIERDVKWSQESSVWQLNAVAEMPPLLLRDVLSVLIVVAGGQPYRPALAKLAPIMDAVAQRKNTKHAVGRAIIEVRNGSISIQRESRRRNENLPETDPDMRENGLNRFRSSADDPLAKALERIARNCS